MEDKNQLLKNIVTDLLSNGKKKNWTDYALECGLPTDKYETCRGRWKNFKKNFLPKGLWGPNDAITDAWKDKVERAMAVERGEESVPEAPAGFTTNRMHQQQTKDGGLIWLQSVERDKEVDAAKEFYDRAISSFENIVIKYEPTKIYLLPKTEPTHYCLNILISDPHVGADIPNSMWGDSYSKDIYLERMKRVLRVIHDKYMLYGTFHTINIVILGDTTDGAGTNQTVRTGHALEQNLTPHDQFDVFVKSVIDLFDSLVTEGYSHNLRFVSATNDNHSGPFGYAASRAVEIYLNARFPDIDTVVNKDFIFHFQTGNKTFITTHGKDAAYLKSGLPMILTPQQEAWIENYMLFHGVNKLIPFNMERHYTYLLAGDLHQSHTQYMRKFTYKRVMSFFGATNYIDFNYSKGSGYKGFESMVFTLEGPDCSEERHFFL